MSPAQNLHNLNIRQKQVLSAIIDHYVVKAEPISSKLLSERSHFQTSSATIRNTMAELEEMGLVEQPHASAGRLPTDRGYRAYVDDLTRIEELSLVEKAFIEAEVENTREEQELLSHSAAMLGKLTNLLGVAVSPSPEKGVFKNLALVPLSGQKVMLVLTISDILFRTVLVESGQDTSIIRLEALAERINGQMQGKPVSLLNSFLEHQIENPVSVDELKAFQFFGRSISKLWATQDQHEIEIAGTKNILGQPDFEKFEDIEGVLGLLDSRITLVHFLRQRSEYEGVHVTIGDENTNGSFQSISIITSAFSMAGEHGIVGVIGPKRMSYGRIISIVDYTARTLSKKHGGERPD